MNRSLALALILIALFVGFLGGYALTPSYTQMRTEQLSSMELGPADQQLDKRYLNGMIAHHLSAIDMAEQALQNSEREEVRSLAQVIIDADTKGIEELYAWKKDWYSDTKKVERFQEVNLGTKDETFDLRFLNALIAHHEEAIMLNKEIQTKSSRNEVLTLAGNVVTGLSAGVEQLETWRGAWYGNN